MTALVLSQVGEANAANGQQPAVRSARLGDLIVSEARGRYAEMTRLGRSFSGVLAATTGTIAAGNILAAAGAASTQFALWNPTGSGVNVEITGVYIGPISGTPPGGPVFHGISTTATSIAGTAGVNNLAGGVASLARFQASAAGSALTAGSAPATLRPINGFNPSAAAFASAAGGTPIYEQTDGGIVLGPGTMWVPLWATAGTTFLNAYGVTWNEVPI